MKGHWINGRYYTLPKGKGQYERTKYAKTRRPDGYYTDSTPVKNSRFYRTFSSGPIGKPYTYVSTSSASRTTNLGSTCFSYRGKMPEPDQHGWLPVHEFTMNKGSIQIKGDWRVHATYGTYQYEDEGRGVPAVVYNYHPYYVELDTDERQALIDESRQKAYAKAAAAKFDTAVQMAELDEALASLLKAAPRDVGSIKRFVKSLKDSVKRGKGGKTFLPTDKSGETWLTWRYGILPMILSYEDLMEFLRSPKKLMRTASGGVHRKRTVTEFRTFQKWNKKFVFKVTTTYEQWASTKLFLAGVVDPHAMGMGAYDGLRALWERTPYSFVVDWILNIGLALDAHRPVQVNVAHQSTTYCSKVKRVVKFYKVEPAISNYKVDSYDMSWQFIGKKFHIERLNDITKPHLPVFSKKDWIPERKLDALALLWLKARRSF